MRVQVKTSKRLKKRLIILYACGFGFFLVVFSIPNSPGWLVWVSLVIFFVVNIVLSFVSLKIFVENTKPNKY